MAKSLPLWSALLSQFSEHWFFYVLMAYLPTYLHSVLHVDLRAVSATRMRLCCFKASSRDLGLPDGHQARGPGPSGRRCDLLNSDPSQGGLPLWGGRTVWF